MKYTCIIVDDEPLAQDVLENYVAKFDNLSLEGKCNNAKEAEQKLKETRIDVMFLDINMPGISGLDFIRSLEERPAVILTTAHAEHAVEGFELNAMDYLLKPISFDRFSRAVNKAIHYLALEQQDEQISPEEDDHMFVKADKKMVKIKLDDILYIEGLKDYVMIFVPGQRIITLQTMKNLEHRLPTGKFIRVHRSFIISVDRIKAVAGHSVEIGEKKIPIGKNYKEAFMKLIEQQNFVR